MARPTFKYFFTWLLIASFIALLNVLAYYILNDVRLGIRVTAHLFLTIFCVWYALYSKYLSDDNG